MDESKVDYSSSTDLELWTTATWTSSNTGVISFKEVSYPYFAPYTVTVAQPKKDTSVTLTLNLNHQNHNLQWTEMLLLILLENLSVNLILGEVITHHLVKVPVQIVVVYVSGHTMTMV